MLRCIFFSQYFPDPFVFCRRDPVFDSFLYLCNCVANRVRFGSDPGPDTTFCFDAGPVAKLIVDKFSHEVYIIGLQQDFSSRFELF
jgi:hypothetical protein